MVDTLALLLMLVSLLLAPAKPKQLTVDLLNVKENKVSTVIATRTKTGFEVRELKNGKVRGKVVYTRGSDPKKPYVWTVKLGPKDHPITVDATEAMASVKSGKIPLGRDSAVLRRSGDVTYLILSKPGQVVSVRPGDATQKASSGK